jgi:3-deoxy-D-manno-octulosonate cytidylyltransferase
LTDPSDRATPEARGRVRGGVADRSRVVAVIPARWASSRLPGKPLADIHGLPMVEHVRRRVVESGAVGRVIVATDDERIARAVEEHGGEAVLTGEHPNGTHRVAAVAGETDAELVVNVQGDMPLLDPAHVRALVGELERGAAIATLATPLEGDPHDRHVVKVVVGRDGRALYFSRSAIPSGGPWSRHLGLYGFDRGALRRAIAAPASRLERSEDLEQLRWMDAGLPITVATVDRAAPGVDTPEQLETVRHLLSTLPSSPSEADPHA